MSFIAGIITTNRDLEELQKRRFLNSLAWMKRELPWQVETMVAGRIVFTWGGFPHMWQGPRLRTCNDYHAVAEGVQWRKVPQGSALDYLAGAFLSEGTIRGNYFERFSCAVLDNRSGNAILATDPLGASSLLYAWHGNALLFSSHQIFLRHYLGNEMRINWNGVFEYLLIGHNIGNKTLLKEINVLPPGGKLELKNAELSLGRYLKFEETAIEREQSENEAGDRILEHLMRKSDGYAELATQPFAVFLSGGRDSRLILSLLVQTKKVSMTYTTQQHKRFCDRLISEKKIASEVALLNGVRNRFVAPVPGINGKRARAMDYATWLHGWSFMMLERVPFDKFVFSDGYMGATWYASRYVSEELKRCIIDNDRERAARIFHSRYLEGYDYYTPGMSEWRDVLDSSYLDECAAVLKQDISEEMHEISSDSFVCPFFIKNRARRGILMLPKLVWGRKGSVVMPFCDFEFGQMVLSLPLKYKVGERLYNTLSRKVEVGLSSILIPSTNTKEHGRLEPYLIDGYPRESWLSSMRYVLQNCCSTLLSTRSGRDDSLAGVSGDSDCTAVFEEPPLFFIDMLDARLKKAIKKGDTGYVRRCNHFLKLIMFLDAFFRGK